jgi:hypothetical protein
MAVEREHVVGDRELGVGREAEDLLDRLTSSAPSGLPWALAVSWNLGDG